MYHLIYANGDVLEGKLEVEISNNLEENYKHQIVVAFRHVAEATTICLKAALGNLSSVSLLIYLHVLIYRLLTYL